jgi:hypothetical protein
MRSKNHDAWDIVLWNATQYGLHTQTADNEAAILRAERRLRNAIATWAMIEIRGALRGEAPRRKL